MDDLAPLSSLGVCSQGIKCEHGLREGFVQIVRAKAEVENLSLCSTHAGTAEENAWHVDKRNSNTRDCHSVSSIDACEAVRLNSRVPFRALG